MHFELCPITQPLFIGSHTSIKSLDNTLKELHTKLTPTIPAIPTSIPLVEAGFNTYINHTSQFATAAKIGYRVINDNSTHFTQLPTDYQYSNISSSPQPENPITCYNWSSSNPYIQPIYYLPNNPLQASLNTQANTPFCQHCLNHSQNPEPYRNYYQLIPLKSSTQTYEYAIGLLHSESIKHDWKQLYQSCIKSNSIIVGSAINKIPLNYLISCMREKECNQTPYSPISAYKLTPLECRKLHQILTVFLYFSLQEETFKTFPTQESTIDITNTLWPENHNTIFPLLHELEEYEIQIATATQTTFLPAITSPSPPQCAYAPEPSTPYNHNHAPTQNRDKAIEPIYSYFSFSQIFSEQKDKTDQLSCFSATINPEDNSTNAASIQVEQLSTIMGQTATLTELEIEIPNINDEAPDNTGSPELIEPSVIGKKPSAVARQASTKAKRPSGVKTQYSTAGTIKKSNEPLKSIKQKSKIKTVIQASSKLLLPAKTEDFIKLIKELSNQVTQQVSYDKDTLHCLSLQKLKSSDQGLEVSIVSINIEDIISWNTIIKNCTTLPPLKLIAHVIEFLSPNKQHPSSFNSVLAINSLSANNKASISQQLQSIMAIKAGYTLYKLFPTILPAIPINFKHEHLDIHALTIISDILHGEQDLDIGIESDKTINIQGVIEVLNCSITNLVLAQFMNSGTIYQVKSRKSQNVNELQLW